MKKWLAFTLLLIALAGSFFPCCTVDDCAADHAQTGQHKEGDSKKGTCSPFFACNYCAGFVLLDKPVLILPPVSQKTVLYELIYSITPEEFYSSFWQPPRHC